MAYTPEAWKKGSGPEYKPNDYLYAEDINKMIDLFNSFIVFENNKFKGIKIPKTGLTLVTGNDKEWLLTVDENGILQTATKE